MKHFFMRMAGQYRQVSVRVHQKMFIVIEYTLAMEHLGESDRKEENHV